jgi:hypothetical protein
MTRTFHLIDIENLVDHELPDELAIRQAIATYRDCVEIGPDDQVLIGTNMSPLYRLNVGLAWPGGRVVAGHGPDGADRAMLEAIDPSWLICRGFDRIVVGSGDHCFAPLARHLKRAGLTVEVVGRSHEIHWSLWPASHLVTALPTDTAKAVASSEAPVELATAA